MFPDKLIPSLYSNTLLSINQKEINIVTIFVTIHSNSKCEGKSPVLTSIPAESSGLPESSLPIGLKLEHSVAHSKYAIPYLELLNYSAQS